MLRDWLLKAAALLSGGGGRLRERAPLGAGVGLGDDVQVGGRIWAYTDDGALVVPHRGTDARGDGVPRARRGAREGGGGGGGGGSGVRAHAHNVGEARSERSAAAPLGHAAFARRGGGGSSGVSGGGGGVRSARRRLGLHIQRLFRRHVRVHHHVAEFVGGVHDF
eukprot:1611459-Pleurochrysis_carterae.AAC.4